MRKGWIDVHCHMLPGVDDGAKTMEEALQMAQIAYQGGIRQIVLTPHFGDERRKTETEKIDRAFVVFQKELKKKLPELKSYLGNEIYYGPGISEYVKSGEARTLAHSKYVLVEFAPECRYEEIFQAVREFTWVRLRPVIAHVERYICLYKRRDRLEELLEQGAFLQLNSEGILGGIFSQRTRWSRRLVKEGYIQLIGTDAHNCKSRAPSMQKSYEWVAKRCGQQMAEELFYQNANIILEDGVI